MSEIHQNSPEEIDDESPYAAQGYLDGLIVQALFFGRPSDDPAANDFIRRLEERAAMMTAVAPKNATMLRLVSKIARDTIGLRAREH